MTTVIRVGGEIDTTAPDDPFHSFHTTLSNGNIVRVGVLLPDPDSFDFGDGSSSAIAAQVVTANGIPVSDRLIVNTATSGPQDDPHVAALTTGGFVVTWRDASQGVGGATGDTSWYAVKAQVFDPNGVRVGTEILVNTATERSQLEQQIVALPNGGFAVTWTDLSQVSGTNGSEIKAQVFGADGTPVGSEILVNTASANGQQRPQITALSNGGFVLTWMDDDPGVGGATGDTSLSAIKAQVFTAGGAPVGGEILVNTAISDEQIDPRIMALSNGGFGVTWTDFSHGVGGATGDVSGTAIKAQVFAADGARVGNEILVNTTTPGDQLDPYISILANGDFMVTWRDVGGTGGTKGQTFALIEEPVAHDDAFVTPETTALSGGNLFADNGAGADNDPDGPAFLVTAVNGSAANVGSPITLSSGAHLTVNPDGTFSYDPNHAFDYLATPSSGASNSPATDHFTYSVTAGSTATVTITVTGVDSNDVLEGTAGPDVLRAGIGTDTLNGGGGNDTLDGGAGADILNGGPGTNTASYLSAGGGVTVDLAAPGSNTGDAQGDIYISIVNLIGSNFTDVLLGDAGDNALDGGAGADTLNGRGGTNSASYQSAGAGVTADLATPGSNTGDAQGDTYIAIANLIGSNFADVLRGDVNNNMLDGGAGADRLFGGLGDDTYVVDSVDDLTIENANEGVDTVTATTHHWLLPNVENLVLLGGSDLQGYGNSLPNMITGNAGSNVLNGGGGADTMAGGAGGDAYFVDDVNDAVLENDGAGNDTVFSTALFYVLSANVENLVLHGSGDQEGYGNSLSNQIYGNAGNNLLNGGIGSDAMFGGTGNDLYFVDDAGDAVFENSDEGSDTVYATTHFRLPENVEILTLLGSTDLQGYGGAQANVLRGNNGHNLLDGGAAADTMAGGAGNDVYVVDDAGDTVTENADEGWDTVLSSAHFALSANVEFLVLQGSADLQGYGNNLANALYGNSGNNLLSGGGGADYMVGALGNDVYVVDDAGDAVAENADEGWDTVLSSAHFALSANVEFLVLQGNADLQGYGNNLSNGLYGNSGNNLLDGGTGADFMSGGGGNDIYFVENAGDMVVENADDGTDAVFSAINYTLAANVEQLVLQGSANLTGTGNALNNALHGNSGANTLDGGAGADVLIGNAGNDTFVFNAGQADGDTVTDFTGNGASAGDSLLFVGYGPAATFTSLDSTHWQVSYNGGVSHDIINFSNGAAIDATDLFFV